MELDKVIIQPVNEVYIKILTTRSIDKELSEYFSFYEKGYKYDKRYINKFWDGKKRLYNIKTKLIYVGLLNEIEKFCLERKYEFECLDLDLLKSEMSAKEVVDFVNTLNLPVTPHDYQLKGFVDGIRNKRNVFISSTGSGKSLLAYLFVRYFLCKTLIIVPTVSLVHQLFSDFIDYGFDSNKFVHKIYEGQDKYTKKPIIITTWQSLIDLPDEWFSDIELIIGDEVHLFRAKSLIEIMEKTVNCKRKFGLTGTLDGLEVSQYVLQGLFGPIKTITTTSDLIERNILSDLEIKCLILSYTNVTKNLSWKDEVEFLVGNKKRNNFIKNLALSLNTNTLLLYNYVDKHGKVLYDLLSKETDRPLFFIDASVDGEIRNDIRQQIEESKNAIIVASVGTFSTGINIKNLHNVIFCFPSKSRVRNLQSIGRVLRKHETKSKAVLYDIVDNLTFKGVKNTSLEHFNERLKIYIESKFNYKTYNIKIEG